MESKEPRPIPVAVSDIAALLGVSVNTVNQWRKRAASAKQVEPFPDASGKVAGTDYWWADRDRGVGQADGSPQRLKPDTSRDTARRASACIQALPS